MKSINENSLYTKPSKIHGKGLFSKSKIPVGYIVIEYIGIKVGTLMADKLEKFYKTNNIESIYLFKINDDEIIDATVYVNDSRFINHSCIPNCKAIVRNDRIFIISLIDIDVDEEITICYNFNKTGDNDVCKCGTECCRKLL